MCAIVNRCSNNAAVHSKSVRSRSTTDASKHIAASQAIHGCQSLTCRRAACTMSSTMPTMLGMLAKKRGPSGGLVGASDHARHACQSLNQPCLATLPDMQ